MDTVRMFGWIAVSNKVQGDTDRTSIPNQQALIQQHTERMGGRLIKSVVIKHSRGQRNLEAMGKIFAKHKVTALQELEEAIEQDTFDILILAEADRLARKMITFLQLLDMVIAAGKKIYCIADGMMIETEEEAANWGIFRGWYAQTYVSQLRRRSKAGKRIRVAQGVMSNGHPLVTHKEVKDPTAPAGRRTIFKSEQRRMWDDVATLLLSGVSWKKLPTELYTRFGHVDPNTGKPWLFTRLYEVIHNPYFWGHSAENYSANHKNRRWMYDETVPAPEGVTVHRNMFPPVWDGEVRQNMIQLLSMKHELWHGKTNHRGQYPLTGMLICDSCGARMIVDRKERSGRVDIYWHCRGQIRHRADPTYPDCDNVQYIRNDEAIAGVTNWLSDLLNAKDLSAFFARSHPDENQTRLASVTIELREARNEIAALIKAQARAPEPSQAFYQDNIDQLAERIPILERELTALSLPARVNAFASVSREHALADIKAIGLERFWQQEPAHINRQLFALLSGYRFAIHNREFKAITPVGG